MWLNTVLWPCPRPFPLVQNRVWPCKTTVWYTPFFPLCPPLSPGTVLGNNDNGERGLHTLEPRRLSPTSMDWQAQQSLTVDNPPRYDSCDFCHTLVKQLLAPHISATSTTWLQLAAQIRVIVRLFIHLTGNGHIIVLLQRIILSRLPDIHGSYSHVSVQTCNQRHILYLPKPLMNAIRTDLSTQSGLVWWFLHVLWQQMTSDCHLKLLQRETHGRQVGTGRGLWVVRKEPSEIGGDEISMIINQWASG